MSGLRRVSVGVVDDDESLCTSMARLLRAAGMQPVAYRSAEAFLGDDHRPEFDCLVLDIQMDGLSGIELHERLAAGGSTTPVIYVTAHDEPEIRKRALLSGCEAYLRKTDSSDTILAAIRHAVHHENHQARGSGIP